MIVMPSNNIRAYELDEQYPGRIAMLATPDNWFYIERLPYSIDNGRFGFLADKCFEWNERRWLATLEKSATSKRQPDWIVVPDMPGDHEETRRLWDLWHWHLVRDYPEWKFAFAVQDGATVDTVPENADVLFVGGTTKWKYQSIWYWCREQPKPVHVGRINGEVMLWRCHEAGVVSCDGTGWFRGNKNQLAGLHRYLRESTIGQYPPCLLRSSWLLNRN